MAAETSQVTGHRLFFALVPDPRTRRRVERVQRKLKGLCEKRGRLVKASNYHVTLAFLGSQPLDQLPRLQALASGLDMPVCSVQMDRLGSFPRAGVIWLGATRIPNALCAFQARLLTGLEGLQIAFDHKPWQFHLTLYRDLRTTLVKIDMDTVNWKLDGFALVESINTGRGVEYRQLGHWRAGAPAIEHGSV